MTDIQPKYFDNTAPCLSYWEWTAIKKFAFNGRAGDILKLLIAIGNRRYGLKPCTGRAKQHHKDILTNISSGQIADLDTFYDAASQMRKPKRRGKMLKDEKKRTAQEIST